MITQPKVSVIMPSLNVAPYIRECIESVINQTLKEIEIICVDAGSNDGTLEILHEYATKDSRIKLINTNKKSYGYQINLGIDVARGEYMGIVETDDYILPNMYEELYETAKIKNSVIIKSDFQRFWGNGLQRKFEYIPLIEDNSLYEKVINAHDTPRIMYANNINPTGIYLLSFVKDKNIRLNETPGAAYQDNGLWFQLFTQAEHIYFIHKAFYMIRRDNPNSSIKNTGKVFCMCEEYDFIRNFLSRNPSLEKKFATLCAYFRYTNYEFTLNRIAPEFKLAFLRCFSDHFKKIQQDGELEETLYSVQKLNCIKKIIENPDLYYYQNVYKPSANKALTVAAYNELQQIKRSISYRIGRAITFMPRKIRDGFRCYREHGFCYTCKRTLFHINRFLSVRTGSS
jgi:glycosyltransferase involved in cell wall biosynthesis